MEPSSLTSSRNNLIFIDSGSVNMYSNVKGLSINGSGLNVKVVICYA